MKFTSSRILKCGNLLSMAVALVLGVSAETGKSVFSDAAVWIKGAYDGTGTAGIIDQGDIRNAMDMSAAITGSAVYGGSANRQYVREDVLCPYTGTVISNVPCINLAQAVVDGKCNWTSLKLAGEGGPVCVTDCCATVVARIRPEAFTNPTKAYWLFGGMGFLFGFVEDPEKPGLLRMRGYYGGIWQTTDFYAEPGTWIDVAVVRETEKGFRFYAVTNGVMWSQWKYASDTGIECGIKTDLYLGLNQNGNNAGPVDITSTTNWRRLSYRGLIQSFAVWNRLLTDAEIREAFAVPRTDIARIGLTDGAAGEFVKESPDGTPVNANDWYGMPAALAPGEEVDIAFWLKDYEHSLPQVLRVTAAPGTSPNVGLSVSVNGSVLPKALPVQAGATKSLFLPGELFLSGSNTLHIANNSSGTVRFDALALGGSWQVGYEDSFNTEFFGNNNDWYVEDGNFAHFPQHALVDTSRTLTVTVSDELANSCHPAVFTVGIRVASDISSITPVPSCELSVNGVPKGSMEFSSRYQTFSVKLAQGELKAGANQFTFTNRVPSGTKNAWMQFDFWRLEMKAIPPGFVVLLK